MNNPLLTNALFHEFQRCRDAFNSYVLFHSMIISKNTDKKLAIACYNAYVDFVSHLYEFYLGNIKREHKYKNVKGKAVDTIINNEVEKLFKIKRDRILHGDAPAYENHISCYEIEIPEEFGREFRAVRNLRSHAVEERSEFDLAAFYTKYHKFVYVLFEYPHWLWSSEKFPDHNWLAIERFSSAITASRT